MITQILSVSVSHSITMLKPIIILSLLAVVNCEPVGKCPPKNPANPVYLPDSEDCSLFYECESGDPQLKECQLGLVFNPKLNVCDFPENVPGCNNGTRGFYDSLNEDELLELFDMIAFNPVVQQKRPKKPVETCDTNSGSLQLIPDNEDCTIYYICDDGVPIKTDCSPGLHFSPTLHVCDYPDSAGCTAGDGNTKPPTTEEPTRPPTSEEPTDPPTRPPTRPPTTEEPTDPPRPTTEEPTNPPTRPPTTEEPTDPPRPTTEEPTDPPTTEEPTDPPTRPPTRPPTTEEPTDPPTTEEPIDPSTEDPPTKPSTTTTTTTTRRPTTRRQDEDMMRQPVGACPQAHPGYPVYLADATDCSLYYICDFGIPYPMKCRSGLQFNVELSICDLPEKSSCTLNQ